MALNLIDFINKMNEWFKLGGDRLEGSKFMVTADDGKMTTFGGLGDTIYQPNSEELFLRSGVWVNLEDIKVTDPFDQKVLPLVTSSLKYLYNCSNSTNPLSASCESNPISTRNSSDCEFIMSNEPCVCP